MVGNRQGGRLNLVCLGLLVVGMGASVAGHWRVGIPMMLLALLLAVVNAIRVYRR